MRAFWNLLQDKLGKDFTSDDALHADVRRLSLTFTEGRESLDPGYLKDERVQRAYLAYFTPLNFEKVRSLLKAHKGVWPELGAKSKKTLYWLDLGCGPGTATLAALANYAELANKGDLPHVHIDLVDNESSTLALAKDLVTKFAASIGVKAIVETHANLPTGRTYDLTLAANVLNELPPMADEQRELMLEAWDVTRGTLFVLEPGHRVSSQRLIRFRERLLKETGAHSGAGVEKLPGGARILGPCMHTERCPLYRTNHWCHFSEPVQDGRLTDLNLRIFKNPRNWLKFSYLIVKREEEPGLRPLWPDPKAEKGDLTYRAIGDLHMSGGKMWLAIDFCQPKHKHVLRVSVKLPPPIKAKLVRGAIVTMGADERIHARTMTKWPEPESRDREDQDERPKPRTTPRAGSKAGALPRPKIGTLPKPNLGGLPKPKKPFRKPRSA